MLKSSISNLPVKTGAAEPSNTTRTSSSSPLRYGQIRYAVVDVEIGLTDHRIHDIGALRYDGAIFHKASKEELLPFLERVEYLCGHNIIHHDAKYLFEDQQIPWRLVDTLYLSPLLFPERPYHRLVKDDKLVSDQMNNPVNDCEKARDLLLDEMARWDAWPEQKRSLFTALLRGQPEFDGFLDLMGAGPKDCNLSEQIATVYRGCICQNADLEPLIEHYPCERPITAPSRRDGYYTTTRAWSSPSRSCATPPALQAVPTAMPNSTSTAASSHCSVTMPSAPTKVSLSRSGRHRQPSKGAHCWQSSRPVVGSRSPSSCRLLWQDARFTDSQW